MRKTVKLSLIATAAAVFAAGSAFAAQNVANTNQKGSLLVWPLITVEPNRDTFIEISNDAYRTIHIECYYVNEQKGRVDFDFDLTSKQTASWSVATLASDQVTPPPFPNTPGSPPYTAPGTSVYRGLLACFATNPGRSFQVAWNELTGTAVVNTSGQGPSSTMPGPSLRGTQTASPLITRDGLRERRAICS